MYCQSTMKSEFIAPNKAKEEEEEEEEWFYNFLKDIPCWKKLVHIISIHCNNQSTIGRAQNSMYMVSLDIYVEDTIQ